MIAILVVIVASLPVIARHPTHPALLKDTDTGFLLQTIREKKQPLSWFTGDWPLGNHFYRPVPTLTFEVDNQLYGDNATGYGWTNTLICVSCIFMLFWFTREFVDNVSVAAACASLFALWSVDWGPYLVIPAYCLAAAMLIVGILRHGGAVGRYAPGVLLSIFLGSELNGLSHLGYRTEGWLPGRTATVMTFFALASMASYARYARLHSSRVAPVITPLDLPATRTSVQAAPAKPPAWLWTALSLFCAAAALASYEQAVMLPAALTAVFLAFRFRGFKVRPFLPVASWILLVAYLAFRHAVVPSATSAYQAQQMRHGISVYFEIADYLAPALTDIRQLFVVLSDGPAMLTTMTPFMLTLGIAANAYAYFEARKQWVVAFATLGLSLVTYMPMAFVKAFDHYHYWPMAMRSIFVITLMGIVGQDLISAASLRALQAPKRLSPAPGSLPHP